MKTPTEMLEHLRATGDFDRPYTMTRGEAALRMLTMETLVATVGDLQKRVEELEKRVGERGR